jgi:hypothetical protein
LRTAAARNHRSLNCSWSPNVTGEELKPEKIVYAASARVALNDCRCAFSKHTSELQAEEFRVSWVALVSLLRTVGYVLKEVDSLRSSHLKQAIVAAWEDLKGTEPKPEIFWEFIDKDRHGVLHHYKVGVWRLACEPGRPGQLNVIVDLGSMEGKNDRVARATRGRRRGDRMVAAVPGQGRLRGREAGEVENVSVALEDEKE